MSKVADLVPVSLSSDDIPISSLACITISRRNAIKMAERRMALNVSGKLCATHADEHVTPVPDPRA